MLIIHSICDLLILGGMVSLFIVLNADMLLLTKAPKFLPASFLYMEKHLRGCHILQGSQFSEINFIGNGKIFSFLVFT